MILLTGVVKLNERFKAGHEYQFYVQVVPETGCLFDLSSLSGKIDGKPAEVYGTESSLTLCYIYPPCDDDNVHLCNPNQLIARKEPTCTTDGKEAYYRCSCGACYRKDDGSGFIDNIASWGILKATGHKAATE